MSTTVVVTGDPSEVLRRGRLFLEREPVLHNRILTLVGARVARPEPGRYWLALRNDDVAGVAFQSPLEFFVTVTPMTPAVVDGVVEAIAAAGVRPPGVSGDAGTAARFAGRWTERTRSAARPRWASGSPRSERCRRLTWSGPPGSLSTGTAPCSRAG